MTRRLRHIVVWLLLVLVWLGTAANGTVRLKNYDIWKDLPSKTLREMGHRYLFANNPDSALVCYTIVANRYNTTSKSDKEELKWVGSAMNQLGIMYTYFFVDYEKANRYLLQAKKIAEQNDDKKLLAAVYINLCNIRIVDDTFMGDGKISDNTIELYLKAFEASLDAANPEAILISAEGLAHMASVSIKNEALLDDISQFLKYQMPDSIKKYECVYDYCKAAMELSRGNKEAALSLYDQALSHVYYKEERNQEILTINILEDKCRLLLELNRYQDMLDILEGFVQQGEATDDHQLQYNAYQALAEYYHGIANDKPTGDRYELMALREKDIMLKENKLLDANKTEFLFQIDEINAEVQELNYRQRLMKIIAWCIAAVVLLILGFLYLLWRKYMQEQEKNRKLYENNLALLAAEDERRQQIIEAGEHKYQSHQMEEGEQSDLLHRIFYVMETNDEVFSPGFTLPRLAELVDDTRNNVSEAINQLYNTNFNGLINEYRIKEACRRINDEDHYGNLTIEAIGQSLGFKSNSNFVSNFKKITGLTPSAYRKQGKAGPVSETPSVPPKEGEAS